MPTEISDIKLEEELNSVLDKNEIFFARSCFSKTNMQKPSY